MTEPGASGPPPRSGGLVAGLLTFLTSPAVVVQLCGTGSYFLNLVFGLLVSTGAGLLVTRVESRVRRRVLVAVTPLASLLLTATFYAATICHHY